MSRTTGGEKFSRQQEDQGQRPRDHERLASSPTSVAPIRVRTDKQGRYRIALPAGYYQVRSTVKIGLTKLPKPHSVHVRAGHWDKINLFFDTGIR